MSSPFRAGGGIRTPDRLITNQLLYQLSYTSKKIWVVQSTTQLAGTLIRGIAPHRLSLWLCSCSTWTRTRDQRINSPSLYQLSYGTIIKSVVSSEPHTSEVVCGQNKRATPTKQAKPPWLPHEKSTRHTYKTWHTCNNIFKHYSVITNHLLWSDRFNVLSVLGFSPKR